MESEASLTSILVVSKINPTEPGTPKSEALWCNVCASWTRGEHWNQARTTRQKLTTFFYLRWIMNRHLYKTVILVLNGWGPFVNPTSGSSEGSVSPALENLKVLKMLAKNRKFSILARDSPRHFLLPIPNGWSISLGLKNPSASRNRSGLKITRIIFTF